MSTARDLATTPGLSQIADVLAAGGDRLADLLERAEGRLGRVAEGYGPALEGHVSGTLAAGGKRLRPMLVYISAGEPAPAAPVAAAAAAGLLHLTKVRHGARLDATQ